MSVVNLTCHPAAPCPHVREVTVRADRVSGDLIVLYYRIEGDIDQLDLPPQRRTAHTDGLWRDTCFEAFIRARSSRAYVELNFSPSSEWAVYRFEDYRKGMTAVEPDPPPKIICRRRSDRLEADVDVHLDALLPALNGTQADLQLGLTAVLKDRQGRLSYWALAHAPGKPDFHHAAGFVLDLPRAGDTKT